MIEYEFNINDFESTLEPNLKLRSYFSKSLDERFLKLFECEQTFIKIPNKNENKKTNKIMNILNKIKPNKKSSLSQNENNINCNGNIIEEENKCVYGIKKITFEIFNVK